MTSKVKSKLYSDFVIFKRILKEARSFWGSLGIIFVLELLAVPLVLLLPIPMKIAVDSVIGSSPIPVFIDWVTPDFLTDSRSNLLLLAAILQVCVVFLMHFQYMCNFVFQTYTGEKLTISFKEKLFRHVQRLSFSFHDARGTADSIYRIQYDAATIKNITIYGVIPLMSAFLKLIGMVFVISFINWQLALVALLVAPFLYMLAKFYNKKMRPQYGTLKIMESNILSIIQEVMTSFRVVKAFGREDSEQERFVKKSHETIKTKVNLSVAEGAYSIVVNLTTAIGTATIIYLGVSRVLTQTITLGELLMVMTYLTQLYGPLQSISGQTTKFQYYFASAQRAFELLDEVPDVVDKPHAKHLKRARGDIEFKDVSFSYDGKNLVLDKISFKVPQGSRVGIAGKTGAGKSTLVSLLPRFYDPSGGKILLDGTDITDFKLQDLRNQFSIVLQDPVLFSTTIAENILYARPGAGVDDMIEAAKAANAHDFIMELPEKYETKVGERGMRMSGGERQRISLARAFLKDAPILILDEPTSSVDNKTESLIMDAMERLMKNRTTFMIAHRLSTLDKCEIRIEVDAGKIVSSRHAAAKDGAHP